MGFFNIFKRKKEKIADTEIQWNKMWDLWTEEQIESPYKELMNYQSEINNGGHSQYFCNIDNISDLKKEMKELRKILPSNFIDNLDKAYRANQILENEDNEEALETLEECDNVFFDNENEITKILSERASKIEL